MQIEPVQNGVEKKISESERRERSNAKKYEVEKILFCVWPECRDISLQHCTIPQVDHLESLGPVSISQLREIRYATVILI